MDRKREYATVAIYYAGENHASLLANMDDKVLVFDNAESARNFIPLLGDGRICMWSADNESCVFSPMDLSGINRAVIVSPYDIYNLPAGMSVKSETRDIGWTNHVIWSEALSENK